MRVRYNRRAVAQIEEIFAYITQDNPRTATAVVRRIETIAFLIGQYRRWAGQRTWPTFAR